MGLIWVVTNTGGMTMDRWPVFDGASCCAGGGLLCWLFQLYSRSIKDRYAVPQKYKEISSSTVLLLKKNHAPLVSEITLHKRL